MPRKPRMFGSHALHIWLAWLARLAHMARTFGSLARTLATLHMSSNQVSNQLTVIRFLGNNIFQAYWMV